MAEQNQRPGDSNLITRQYMDSILVEPRNIGGCVPSTAWSCFGEAFATPISTAALSHLKSVKGDGMVELARGAALANALMFCGMGPMEQVEKCVQTGAKVVKIIKPYADRADVFTRIKHAKQCGCVAVGMDVDHSFGGNGQPDVVLGYTMEPITFELLKGYIDAAELPFVVKGVLSVHDALLCAEAGAAGIVVSHHHGVLDYAVPPLMALPAIRKAVGKGMKIFVDCGIESGADVFKALALGADGVSIGRALMPACEAEGGEGVATELGKLNDGLRRFMARTCSPTLQKIDPSVVIAPKAL